MSHQLTLLPEDVAEIVALLDGTAYETLEVKTTRFTLRVARSSEGWTQAWEHHTAVVDADAKPDAKATTLDTPIEQEGIAVVRSPLPGTYYRAPKPGAPPFVEVGQRIKPDDIVGIVETMKVMNSVPAGVEGEIVEIVAKDGTMVDPDVILMRVKL